MAPRGERKKPLANDGYHPTDMLVGIGVGLGLSRPEIAAFIGMSEATVDNRKQSDFAKFVAQKTKEASSRFVVQTREDLTKAFEKRWTKALDTLDDALEATRPDGSPDYNAMLRASEVVFDRTLGKPNQKTEVVSEHTETHIFQLSEETLNRVREFANKVTPQLTAAREADVIDVDPEN